MARRTSDKSAKTKVRHSAKVSTHTIYHKDGSIWGKGQMLAGKMHGCWEFYRKDGTIMRSGSFDRGQQIGTWTTYDGAGKPIKVTEMKPAAKTKLRASEAEPRKPVAKSQKRAGRSANPKLTKRPRAAKNST